MTMLCHPVILDAEAECLLWQVSVRDVQMVAFILQVLLLGSRRKIDSSAFSKRDDCKKSRAKPTSLAFRADIFERHRTAREKTHRAIAAHCSRARFTVARAGFKPIAHRALVNYRFDPRLFARLGREPE